jgi:hypothetical protein
MFGGGGGGCGTTSPANWQFVLRIPTLVSARSKVTRYNTCIVEVTLTLQNFCLRSWCVYCTCLITFRALIQSERLLSWKLPFRPRPRCSHLLACCFLAVNPEDGGNTFLRNVDSFTDYTALYPTRWQVLWLALWEPFSQISSLRIQLGNFSPVHICERFCRIHF